MAGDYSRHFSRKEFECKCGECGYKSVDYALILLLEMVRSKFDKPITITSGVRCEDYNLKVGGKTNSKHIPQGGYPDVKMRLGQAIDLKVSGVETKEVYDFLNFTFPNKLGLGLANSFVHVDVRADRAYRWTY